MTIYQELQLNQAGSKAVIKSSLKAETHSYLFVQDFHYDGILHGVCNRVQ